MYEKENLAKGYDTPTESTARRPELIVLIERFQSAVNRFDGLTCEVRTKLQNIKRYSEPEPKMEAQIEKQPESFAEEMHRLICKVEEYNSRLEFNLRHLNEMI